MKEVLEIAGGQLFLYVEDGCIGVAIGSRAFVEDIFLSSRDWFGSRRKICGNISMR